MSDTTPVMTLADGFPAATEADWRALVDKVLKGADFERRLVARTADALRIEPLYSRPSDGAAARGPAGRSPRADGHAWDMRQRYDESDPAAANAAILADLAGGTTSVLLQLAAPGQSGLGYHAADLARALDQVMLDVAPVALDAGEYTPDAAGSLIELWRSRAIAPATRTGAFNYDPLGNLARTGALYNSLPKALKVAAGLIGIVRESPGVTALLADGRPYHAAGASEAQELAALLATLVAYLRAGEAEGHRPAEAAKGIALALAADADLLLTIAKLRAARRLAARVLEACGVAAPGRNLLLTAETATRMMARRDPWVNMLRTTIACTGAAIGGADAISVLPFTHALGRPDAFARRIARNTQTVLAEESGLGRVLDPAAGSGALESLTAGLAAKAWELFQAIEARGGMAVALESGYMRDEIGSIASRRARDVAALKTELTGVNAFPRLGDDGVSVAPRESALPADLNGARISPLVARRLAEPFEALRDAADAHAGRTGAAPKVLLATLGDLASHGARSTWMQNFLAAGGIEATLSGDVRTTPELGRAFADSGATVACLCGADATYAELGEAAAGVLRQAGAVRVLLAGRPGESERQLRAAGVDGFVHLGADAVTLLADLHRSLGVQA